LCATYVGLLVYIFSSDFSKENSFFFENENPTELVNQPEKVSTPPSQAEAVVNVPAPEPRTDLEVKNVSTPSNPVQPSAKPPVHRPGDSPEGSDNQ
ncbi:MAG: hypothetical protein AAF570_28200, partial [Bacteroidota bacterium]